MNNLKAAAFLLLFLVLFMGYGVNIIRGKSAAAGEAAAAARAQAEQAEQSRKIAEIKLKTIDAKTASLRKVYTEWIPHFESFTTPRAAEQKISEIVREGNVFLLSQRFNYQEIDKHDLISHALVGDLEVVDDYAKVINWLGKLEESIPSCRISECKLERGERGNQINMKLKVQVPVLTKSLSAK